MGLPLLNGFIGEFTILGGTFSQKEIAGHSGWFWAAWAVPGVVLAAAYLLWLYQRVFFGTVTNPKNEKLHDLTPREVATFVPLLIMAFWIGLYPKPFFRILEQPVNNLVAIVNGEAPKNETTASAQTTNPVAPAATQALVDPALVSKPAVPTMPQKASAVAAPRIPAKGKN